MMIRMPLKALWSMGPRIWLRWNWVNVGLPLWSRHKPHLKWLCRHGVHDWDYSKTMIRRCERCRKLQYLQTGVWKWNRRQLKWRWSPRKKLGFYWWADGKISAEWRDIDKMHQMR